MTLGCWIERGLGRGPHSATETIEAKEEPLINQTEGYQEYDGEEAREMATLMRLRLEDLQRACKDRAFPSTGTNQLMAERLIQCIPEAEPPTDAQLRAIASMERKHGLRMNTNAQLSTRAASLWIDEMSHK